MSHPFDPEPSSAPPGTGCVVGVIGGVIFIVVTAWAFPKYGALTYFSGLAAFFVACMIGLYLYEEATRDDA